MSIDYKPISTIIKKKEKKEVIEIDKDDEKKPKKENKQVEVKKPKPSRWENPYVFVKVDGKIFRMHNIFYKK